MSELLARRAGGLLARFAEAGLLGVADVHVATRVAALGGETDERAVLALALLVRSTRLGSVVLDLDEVAATTALEADTDSDPGAADDVAGAGPVTGEPDPAALAALPWPEPTAWAAALAASPLTDTTAPGGAPVQRRGARLWLDRYWGQEAGVARALLGRAALPAGDVDPARLDADLAALFPDPADADQREATRVAARSAVAVVVGGPGTGKTTTIARLIAVLRAGSPGLRIALAAPTGRAAARLTEALGAARDPRTGEPLAAVQGLTASTVHRLLGWRPGSSRFRHDRDNRLPFDVVVVDECSMVSLTLMARLLEALGPRTRLVLVGDPDQLASVEAGAVLGDLVAGSRDAPSLRGCVAALTRVHRFAEGGAIADLAAAVRGGRADDALDLLRAGTAGLEFHPTADDDRVEGDALEVLRAGRHHEQAVVAAARRGDAEAALDALDRHRLLCAHRGGPRGVRYWGAQVERWLTADDPTLVARLDTWYAGQPLLVTANDYENDLFNGDTGVVVERHGDLVAVFRRAGVAVSVPLVRLAAVRPLHAMTVHRAQGSQYDEVTVLLPAARSPLATRQTFYTAVTRARRTVRVVGTPAAVLACVGREAARATGLRQRLAGQLD